MKKYVCIIAVMLVAIAWTQAQVLKKLQDKASRAVNRSIDNAANKAVDKAVTKPIDKAVDKALDPGPKNKKQSDSKASADAGSNTPSNTEPDNSQQVESSQTPVKSSLRSPSVDAKYAPEASSANAVQIGDPCATKEELATALGKYFTAAQYPWPAVRAEYFKEMTVPQDKAAAKQTLEQIEKLEQQSRAGFTLAGGSLEAYYSSEGYEYAGAKKLADYRFQAAFHEYICINKKVARNSEYSTVLRVYVNKLPVNTLSPYMRAIAKTGDERYLQKDWKNYKAGVASPEIDVFTYLGCSSPELIAAINSGKGYWQNIPESEIRKNTYEYIYRYWFVKKGDAPMLLPVSRKEYLESLLEFYDRESLYLTKSSNYEAASNETKQAKFGDIPAVLASKKEIVSQALKENSAEWLSRQAMVNETEDLYLNQQQKLPEYSSYLTFHKFYDNEKGSIPLYKYNPAYFSASSKSPANPEFMTIAFRYVHMPAHLSLINNFTKNFEEETWQKLLGSPVNSVRYSR